MNKMKNIPTALCGLSQHKTFYYRFHENMHTLASHITVYAPNHFQSLEIYLSFFLALKDIEFDGKKWRISTDILIFVHFNEHVWNFLFHIYGRKICTAIGLSILWWNVRQNVCFDGTIPTHLHWIYLRWQNAANVRKMIKYAC